jgi:hypothetical protein
MYFRGRFTQSLTRCITTLSPRGLLNLLNSIFCRASIDLNRVYKFSRLGNYTKEVKEEKSINYVINFFKNQYIPHGFTVESGV